MSITIRRADYMDVDALVPLFDGYRQFYKWPSDETLARSFLSERLRAEEAIVFIADVDHQPVGFTLLYPSFSSTAAGRMERMRASPVATRAPPEKPAAKTRAEAPTGSGPTRS